MGNSNVTIDDLAVMIKDGFDGVTKDIDELKKGQERIELRLDNVAYRFELVALEKRVEKLEKLVKV